jgi:hypothetical protein
MPHTPNPMIVKIIKEVKPLQLRWELNKRLNEMCNKCLARDFDSIDNFIKELLSKYPLDAAIRAFISQRSRGAFYGGYPEIGSHRGQ